VRSYLTSQCLLSTSGQSSYQAYQKAKFGRKLITNPSGKTSTPSIQSPCPDRGTCPLLGWQQVEILCSSAVLHSVFDLPVHNHDAQLFSRSAITVSSAPSLTGIRSIMEQWLFLWRGYWYSLRRSMSFLSFMVGKGSSRELGLPDGLFLLLHVQSRCPNSWNSQVSKPRIPLSQRRAS